MRVVRVCVAIATLCACLVLAPVAAFAQASITGVVRDASGGVLPGVTVEASSPALIEKVRVVVTDGSGQFRVVDLRPGTYSVTFTLSGFSKFKRDGIELEGSFTATVNVELPSGTLEETITVSGETPIVDTQSVTQQRVLDKEILDAIPAGRNHANYASLIPGMTGAVDYGGTNNLNLSVLTVHGSRQGDQRVMVDGMSTSATSGSGELSNFIPDITGTEEVAVSYAAGNAEQAFGGVQMNLVPREGGNTFKASLFATGVTRRWQGSNYSDELRLAGLRSPNTIKQIYDVNPGIGGPILRDKLWFYSSFRYQSTETYQAGLWANANAGDLSRWDYDPDYTKPAVHPLVQQSGNGRVTWQASPRNKFSGFYEHQHRVWEQLGATIAPESATKYDFPRNEFVTGTYTSPISNKLLFDVRVSDIVQGWKDRYPSGGSSLEFGQPLPDQFKSLIAVTEQGGLIPNLVYRGAGQTGLGPFIGVSGYIASAQSSLSYVTGSHALKVGFLNTWGERHVDYENIDSAVRYRFNNGVPNQITQSATPYGFTNQLGSELGIYAQDKWTLNRLTLNLGVRFDYLALKFPEQHLGSGTLVPNRDVTFPANDFTSLKDVSPRLGAAYDLFGTGKTALKINVGRYVTSQRLTSNYTDFGNPVNAMSNSVTRSWNDRGNLGVNGDYVPQCDLLNPLVNGECGAISDLRFGQPIPSTATDPEILRGWSKRPYNWEFESSVAHQLLPRVGVEVGYFRRWFGNFWVIDNTATAASDYTRYSIVAPVDARLPDGGGYVVEGLYNLNPDKVGQVSNLFTAASNYGEQTEHWNGVDVNLNVRLGGGTNIQGGFSTGRSSMDVCDVREQVPEMTLTTVSGITTVQGAFAVGQTTPHCAVTGRFLTQVKFLGTYMVPKVGVQVAATYRSLPGPGISASYVADNSVTQPSLGRPLSAGAANATINLVAPGEMFGDQTNLLDLRFSKIFRFAKYRSSVNLDLSNALNSSGITTYNNNYSTWLAPTGIHLARFAKFSLQFDF